MNENRETGGQRGRELRNLSGPGRECGEFRFSPLRKLPLICPICQSSTRNENLLTSDLVCPECGTVFPVREGVPIMLTEPALREAIATDRAVADSRTRFYQEDAGFLRGEGDRKQIENALNTAQADGIVLEVGSGRGVFAGIGGPDYCALDYSFSFLKNYLTSYRSICTSAEAIPLESESCRLIFSVATLEHVPRADLAFAEIDRVLAAGGIAYLDPAWHCRDWAADGLNVRPYRDLSWSQKLRKALIPLRDSIFYRGLKQVPWRAWRRFQVSLSQGRSSLKYRRLNANYENFWCSDSDACSSIDSHEALLFFESRKYQVLRPKGGNVAKLLFRAGPLIVRKTSALP